MTPAEIRWRCERLAVLLQTQSRHSALVSLAAEARRTPWVHDPRPAPTPLPMGGYLGD